MADSQIDGYVRFEDEAILNETDAFNAHSISKYNSSLLVLGTTMHPSNS